MNIAASRAEKCILLTKGIVGQQDGGNGGCGSSRIFLTIERELTVEKQISSPVLVYTNIIVEPKVCPPSHNLQIKSIFDKFTTLLEP